MLITAVRANLQTMQKEIDELMRLDRRIADVRGRIDESEQSDCRFPGSWERIKIRELLSQTLKDLEARKAALERTDYVGAHVGPEVAH
jgi:predicted nuclease with TOPRIM domain